MKVFKFGGASVSTTERIELIRDICKKHPDEKLLVVISAMGKTTNALEKVVAAFFDANRDEALQLFDAIKNAHTDVAKAILKDRYEFYYPGLQDIFTEVEWLLHDKPVREFDYYYDQIVCVGELLSTRIMSAYLNEQGLHNIWTDVRDIFRTDDNFRDAAIDWNITGKNVLSLIVPLFEKTDMVIAQGFIGATDENESTTLGREGSDYTAAVFAAMLDAQDVTIWKDVEGVMNADPKEFTDAIYLRELSYDEVIEMAYYGAQVIHPKTIKPLQNKNIPLHVKCFLDYRLPGTVIGDKSIQHLPPIIVVKRNQALMHLHTRDFSFAGEEGVAGLYDLFLELKVRANLLQTGAVRIDICVDEKEDKLQKLALAASTQFDVQVIRDLSLLTIRHYTEEMLQQFIGGRTVLLRQQTPETIQLLIKN
jgi:aspartate kinase